MEIEQFIKTNSEAKRDMEYSPFSSFNEFWGMVETKNEAAWKIIEDHYSKIMLCYLHRKGVPNEDSKDIVQEVYLKFWRKVSDGNLQFDGGHKQLLVYLLKICEREIFNYLRAKLKIVTGISVDEVEKDKNIIEAIEQFCIEKRVAAKQILEKIINILKDRPHDIDHIKIFEDYYFHGVAINMIAERYKKTSNNIRVILHRQRIYILSKISIDS